MGPNSKLLHQWSNGNSVVSIFEDGTRIVESSQEVLKLEIPLNIDIRVSTQCAFGLNEKTGKAVCSFCHESATTEGQEADFNKLKEILKDLPAGIELAVGVNQFSENLFDFFSFAKSKGWIVNITVNQGLVFRDRSALKKCIENKLVYGIGISYRQSMKHIPSFLMEYEHSVVHVIAGIDDIEDVKKLSQTGVKKLLILGEKDFGFNQGQVNLKSEKHVQWYRQLPLLFSKFEVVSFDNLALEQLNVKRFVLNWQEMYQGEHSFYINAVQGYFAPSSRSPLKTSWLEVGIKDYFKNLEDQSLLDENIRN